MTPPIESTATQTIATIAFGVTATLISVFTVCQGRNAWRRVYGRDNERNAESDIDSQTSIELEAHHVFELSATQYSEYPLNASGLPEQAGLLDPFAASASSTVPATTTSSPA